MKTLQPIFLFLSCFLSIQLTAQSINFDFVENKGQWDSRVKFMGDIGTGAFFLEKNGFTVLVKNVDDLQRLHNAAHGAVHATPGPSGGGQGSSGDANNTARAIQGTSALANIQVRAHAYRVRFEGASADAEIVADKKQDSYNNYFIGDDSTKWARGCRLYRTILYRNVYPGIDVRYYSENGTLKYDIIVNPGADPSQVKMRYEGADKLFTQSNLLFVKTSAGTVKELEPYSYQFDKTSGKTKVACKYEITGGNTVGFKLRGYDKESVLVIDPTLIFSSFSGSRSDNWGFTATPGPDGSLFGGGIVTQNGYPITAGAVQQNPGGDKWDIGLTRFSSDGSSRIYSTYIGGVANDFPLSMISDSKGNLVMMGRTYSTNFPGKLIGVGGGSDLFVLRLNPTGTAFSGAMRIGGKANDAVNIEDQRSVVPTRRVSTLRFYGDDSRGEVILDAASNIYVASQSQSDNFPTVNPFQANLAGKQDGVILKIDPSCNNIIFSSYLGGSADDGAFVMDISPITGNLYVAGPTFSGDFPGPKGGTIQPAINGQQADGFVAEISSSGAGIIRSTFLGTGSYDAIYGLKFDKLGFPYVMGISEGNWPIQNAPYNIPNSRQFISKLKPDLSGFVYSTVFGSGNAGSPNPNISPVAFLVDRCENVYVSGWGGNPFPEGEDVFGQAGVTGMPITPGAIKSITDNRDFYFIVIRKNAAGLLYGTFFGQGGIGPNGFGEHVDGGTSRYDQQGVIYQAICANCGGRGGGQSPNPGYPITPGVVGPVNGTGDNGCNLGVVKIAFNFSGVAAGLRAYINNVLDTAGCVPLTVEFKDTVRTAISYEWDFGDGSPKLATTNFDVQHAYNAIGNYRVMLVAIDSNSCNIRDTAYTTIRVSNNQAFPSFTAAKLLPCESLSYQFTNTSTLSPTAKPFGNQSFVWDFGDGTPRVSSGPSAVTHNYVAPGTYKVTLSLPDTNYCNAPDSTTITLRVAPLVQARFETPPAGCVPYKAVFDNTSLAGTDFVWDFGDGTVVKDNNPTVTHDYTNPGTIVVKLVATDTSTCNKIDSTSFTIVLNQKPTAAFTVSPATPKDNTPATFTNTSSADAVRFKWLFGDGDSLLTSSRLPVDHQYNATGSYNVLLIAYSAAGCPDTARALVVAVVTPRLDVPNAFTPGTNGENSIVYVRGFAIGRMRWRIYNRFGNLVFESNSQRLGWDGKYKGVIQPMDVYAYTLEVEFTDSTRTTRKGDITLLR